VLLDKVRPRSREKRATTTVSWSPEGLGGASPIRAFLRPAKELRMEPRTDTGGSSAAGHPGRHGSRGAAPGRDASVHHQGVDRRAAGDAGGAV